VFVGDAERLDEPVHTSGFPDWRYMRLRASPRALRVRCLHFALVGSTAKFLKVPRGDNDVARVGRCRPSNQADGEAISAERAFKVPGTSR
jgi:hypothetical protein